MKIQGTTVVFSLLLLAAAAAAAGCSCDGRECGPGTHAEGNLCVPDEADDGREDNVEAPEGDVADVPDGGEDFPDDTAEGDEADAVDTTPDGEAPCNVCTEAQKRCQDRQVQVCVTLTDGCTTWSVEKTCSRFEECQEPAMDCAVPETVPPGSFTADVEGASWGIAPESMLWDGETGLVSFGTAESSIRVMGFLRFNASGPVRPARKLTTDDQESSLAVGAGRTFVHWRDSTSHGWIGEVLADESVGTSISSDHNEMGQNVHAFGVGSGVLLYQTSVMGGSNAYLGFFDPGSWSIAWLADQPLFSWNASTAAAVETAGGFAAAWITPDMSSLALQRFDASGTPAGAATVGALTAPVSDAAALALIAETSGYTFVWAADAAIHIALFDPSGTLLGDTAADSGDLALRNPQWVGREGDEIYVSCNPDTSGTALVIVRLGTDGSLLGDTLLTSHGGIARYAAGALAACWGIADVGIGCGVVAFP
jgi:hypothetical protein